jgi:hypothetical protein
MESNVKMVKKNTVSQQKRYDQIPEPVEIDWKSKCPIRYFAHGQNIFLTKCPLTKYL